MCEGRFARGDWVNTALIVFLAINIVFIILFLLGKEVIFKIKNNPNLIAGYALLLGVMFILYFLSIFFVVTISFISHKFLPLSLLGFVFLPFIIGKKVTYEKLDFYSNLQLAVFFASSILALIFLKLY